MAAHPKQHQVDVSCSSCSNSFSLSFVERVEGPMIVESCSFCHPAYTGKRRNVELNAARKFFDKYKSYSSHIGAPSQEASDDKGKQGDKASS
jgi:ribosomal protein L31